MSVGRRGPLADALNAALVPVRLAIPQPFLKWLPPLRTNAEERAFRARRHYRGRALDIGCGFNTLIREYRAEGHDGVGVDVHPWEGRPDLVVEHSARLPFPDQSFDTISLIACINHIPYRESVLREAHRLLAEDGRLIVTNLTPRISRLWHAIAFWDPDQHEREHHHDEVWGFTDRELRELVAAAGFALVVRERFMWGLNSVYVFRPEVGAGAPRADGSRTPQ